MLGVYGLAALLFAPPGIHIGNSYLVCLYGCRPPEVGARTTSGTEYMLWSVGNLGAPGLFTSLDAQRALWRHIESVQLHSHDNNIHEQEILVLAPDESLLFVVRNTREAGREYWTDVISISADKPPQMIFTGPSCCMDEDMPLLEDANQKVRKMALEAGIDPWTYRFPEASRR